MEQKQAQFVTWEQIRSEVMAVEPVLAGIIDQISPDKRYQFVKASYAFGDLIVQDGVTCLPTPRHGVLPFSSPHIDPKIREALSYSPIPLFLTLENSNEVFVDMGTRVVPLRLFYAGSLLGVFETMDYIYQCSSTPMWSVSAGARDIFSLPKISESSGLKRLQLKYQLLSDLSLKTLNDHWRLFKTIAQHSTFEQPWSNTVLFFSKEWMAAEHKNDPEWFAFRSYLFSKAWEQSQFAISKINLSLSWESFIDAMLSRNLQPTPYLIDQAKHLLLIAAGHWPGFRPSDDSQKVAPTRGIENALLETYLLTQYIPTLMHAHSLNNQSPVPVYYSLSHSTLIEGSPKKNGTSTIMLDTREIKLLMDTLNRSFQKDTKFQYDFMKKNRFDYFHVEFDKFNHLTLSTLIPELDNGFSIKNEKGHTFCSTSPFWRGCIRLWPKG